MCGEATSDLPQRLDQLREQRARAEAQRRALLGSQGRPKPGFDKTEARLRRQVSELDEQIAELEKQLRGAKKMETPEPAPTRPVQPEGPAVLQPLPADVWIEVEIDLVRSAFTLGGKARPSRASVPVGSVFVLSHDHETYDQEGLPEVYLAGETVSKSHLRGDAQCWVVELAEFPGMVKLRVSHHLAAVSQTEQDVASLYMSAYVRLEDPILLLRRMGAKWKTDEQRLAVNDKIEKEVGRRLRQILAGEIQLWSADERVVYDRILSGLDSELRRMGLRLDVTSITDAPVAAVRRYPSTLYEVVLQFARAEGVILNQMSMAQQDALCEQTGLLPEDLGAIRAASERRDHLAGTALFGVVKDSPGEVRAKIAVWLDGKAARIAATFVRELYLKEHADRAVRLSEQVLLAAFRNPMLTVGEWLRRETLAPEASPSQRLQRYFEEAAASAKRSL